MCFKIANLIANPASKEFINITGKRLQICQLIMFWRINCTSSYDNKLTNRDYIRRFLLQNLQIRWTVNAHEIPYVLPASFHFQFKSLFN